MVRWVLPDGQVVEPVGRGRAEEILEIYRWCEDFLALGPVGQASLEMVHQDLDLSAAEGGIFCGIFERDGQLVGVFDFIPEGHAGRPEQALLALIMIAAPWRRRGLGAAVVRRAEDELDRSRRVHTILVPVQVNNPGALLFWERCGYREYAGPFQNPDLTTVIYLKKELPG